MRAAAFALTMLALLPMAAARPFVGLLLWCWISFMNPHQQTYGALSALPWALIIFLVTVFGCVIAKEPKRYQVDTATALVIALMVLACLTTATGLVGDDRSTAKFFGVEKMWLGVLLTGALLTSARRVHALVWMMVICLGYWGFRGGGFTLISGGSARVYGPEGTMIQDNNHLAAALLVSLPLMAYLRMRSVHALVRNGLALAMGLTLVSIVGSYSRGALLGLFATLGTMWLRSRNKGFGAVAAVLVVAAAFTFMPPEWVDRMNSIGSNNVDTSSQGRLDIWRASTAIAMARPLGGGFMAPYYQQVVNQYAPGVQARAVHSIYFEVLGEHGFIGLFLFLALIVVTVLNTRAIIRAARGKPELAWAYDLARMAQVSVVAYTVAGAFLSLCYWDFWYTFVMVVAATRQMVRVAAPEPTGWRRQVPAVRAPPREPALAAP